MTIKEILGLRRWKIDRFIGVDVISAQDRAENPFIGNVFKILRGKKTKGLLFLINSVDLDLKEGRHRIDYTLLNVDFVQANGIIPEEIESAVSMVVRDIVVAAAKNLQKKEMMNGTNRENNSTGTLSK